MGSSPPLRRLSWPGWALSTSLSWLCSFPGAPRSLGRGLLRLALRWCDVGPLFRALGGQTLDGRPDPSYGRLAVREFLHRLQLREGRHAREAVPNVDQPRARPLRTELCQLLFRRERLLVIEVGGNRGVRRDVVFRIDRECFHLLFSLLLVAVVTFITPHGRNSKSNLRRLRLRTRRLAGMV